MKLINKKVLSLVLCIIMIAGVLGGCVSKIDTPKTEVSKDNSIMGKVNGVDITRESLGDALKQSEKKVVEEYIDKYLVTEYYKDVEVSDIEVEAQFAIIKGQIVKVDESGESSEAQWTSYLEYIGMKDDNAFKSAIKQDLKGTKKRDEIKATLEATDEDINKHYLEHQADFNLMVGQIIFFDTEEDFDAGVLLNNQGKSLEDISKEVGKDIYKDEHVSFAFEGFEVPMQDVKVGNTIVTKRDSGALAIMLVEKIDKSIDTLKDTVKEDFLNAKAQGILGEKLQSFYKEAKITILGEEIQ